MSQSFTGVAIPTCAMYGIFTFIYEKFRVKCRQIYSTWSVWGTFRSLFDWWTQHRLFRGFTMMIIVVMFIYRKTCMMVRGVQQNHPETHSFFSVPWNHFQMVFHQDCWGVQNRWLIHPFWKTLMESRCFFFLMISLYKYDLFLLYNLMIGM